MHSTAILLDRKDLLVVAIIHDHNVIIFAYESRVKFIFAINSIIISVTTSCLHAFVSFHSRARALSMWSRFANVFLQIHLYPTRELKSLVLYCIFTFFFTWFSRYMVRKRTYGFVCQAKPLIRIVNIIIIIAHGFRFDRIFLILHHNVLHTYS